ncbi:MAG: 4-hydroxy-tetrahydrodipicolinate reductase [Monoglobales bacterium]
MNIIINGALGKMGVELKKIVEKSEKDYSVCIGVDPRADGSDSTIVKNLKDYNGDADIIIDFSHHSATKELMDYAVSRNLAVIVSTTGHDEAELALIKSASEKIPVFHSANMSLGVAMLSDFACCAATLMPDADIEIIETHHNQKLDAPSGTALMLANDIKCVKDDAEFVCGRNGQQKRDKKEIGIHAVRRGDVVGIHEIIFSNGTETITIKHEAHSRSLFADGALIAADFLVGKKPGLYNMNSLVSEIRKP